MVGLLLPFACVNIMILLWVPRMGKLPLDVSKQGCMLHLFVGHIHAKCSSAVEKK